MKKILFALILLLPLLGKAQAHVGSSLEDIKAKHPENVFTINYSKDGQKFATTDMSYGQFFYYFDKVTDLTAYCLQVPKSMIALNAQVELYNKKYVIVSDTSWKAYLGNNAKMNIHLVYDEKYEYYVFTYSN
jgi:hypothetical protein